MLRLGALTKLRRLGLAGTSVKDAGLALVTPLAALEVLNLEWCSRITNAGGQCLCKVHNAVSLRINLSRWHPSTLWQSLSCAGTWSRPQQCHHAGCC